MTLECQLIDVMLSQKRFPVVGLVEEIDPLSPIELSGRLMYLYAKWSNDCLSVCGTLAKSLL